MRSLLIGTLLPISLASPVELSDFRCFAPKVGRRLQSSRRAVNSQQTKLNIDTYAANHLF